MQTRNSEKQSLSLVKKLRKLRIHRGKILNCEMKSHNYLYYFFIPWQKWASIYSQVHKYWDIDTILTFLALYTTTMDFKWNEQDVL